VTIDDLVAVPGRFLRPPKLTIVLRGLPGAGKSTVAKMIKDKEVENGGGAPRILCLDDYFMVEGGEGKARVMQYEFDAALEPRYRASLIKSYRKQVDDGFFPFIILDCINDRVEHFQEVLNYSAANGFEVYLGEVAVDPLEGHARSTHKRAPDLVKKMAAAWEPAPPHVPRVDLTSMLQDASVTEVEMEDCSAPPAAAAAAPAPEQPPQDAADATTAANGAADSDDEDSQDAYKTFANLVSSKWDTEETHTAKMDKLDGVGLAKRRIEESHAHTTSQPESIQDWLQEGRDYDSRQASAGKKRVRWADFEERRAQASARERGFVLGQTDWSLLTDTDQDLGRDALVQIRYIPPRDAANK